MTHTSTHTRTRTRTRVVVAKPLAGKSRSGHALCFAVGPPPAALGLSYAPSPFYRPGACRSPAVEAASRLTGLDPHQTPAAGSSPRATARPVLPAFGWLGPVMPIAFVVPTHNLGSCACGRSGPVLPLLRSRAVSFHFVIASGNGGGSAHAGVAKPARYRTLSRGASRRGVAFREGLLSEGEEASPLAS
jgi:hypothetical protein